MFSICIAFWKCHKSILWFVFVSNIYCWGGFFEIVGCYYVYKLFILYNLPLNLDVVCSNRDGRKSGLQIYFSIGRLCANGNGGERYISFTEQSLFSEVLFRAISIRQFLYCLPDWEFLCLTSVPTPKSFPVLCANEFPVEFISTFIWDPIKDGLYLIEREDCWLRLHLSFSFSEVCRVCHLQSFT